MTLGQDFGWTKFYMEFADKLLDHRRDRGELVAKVREVCNRLGYQYLDNSGPAVEASGLPDICPFTVMGTFNREIRLTNRKAIAAEIGQFLGVGEPAPDSFAGIPTLALPLSVVFWELEGVGPLWQVFEDAINLAASDDVHARQSFVDSYDRAIQARGVGVNLTMGLFWIRPGRYLPFDSKSREYIGSRLEVDLPDQVRPTGIEYLQLSDVLKERFDDDAFPVHSFQELSLAAYEPPVTNNGEKRPRPAPPEAIKGSESPETDPPANTYTLDTILAEGCFLEQSKLETILNRIKTKRNLILQGPPGTGKTWLAKRLAYALIGEKDKRRVRSLQFHPTLSYEDFIRGYRPDGAGKLVLIDGSFLEVIEAAKSDETGVYVVVIEEINRGNPAQIFGEMLTLLEADKRDPDEALMLAHSEVGSEQVYIPQNVYVIGTMNIADRSIALVDLALRRRFAFVTLEPIFGDVWRNWVNDNFDIPLEFLTTIRDRISALNERITADRSLGPQFRVGHSYVTPVPDMEIDDPITWFTDIVDTDIGPLLDEYWFDNASEAANAKRELLSGL